MFSKVKKLFTVLAVTMMVASSLPLNVLADETEPTSTENVTSNSSEVQKEPSSSSTSTSKNAEIATTTSEVPSVSNKEGTPSQPNAPNVTTSSTTETTTTSSTTNADIAKSDLASKLAELGLRYKDKQLTILGDGSAYLNPEIMDKAISMIKDVEGTSTVRRRMARAVSDTIWVDQASGIVPVLKLSCQGNSETKPPSTKSVRRNT